MISAPIIAALVIPPASDPWEQGNTKAMLQDLEIIMASQLARAGHIYRVALPPARFNLASNTKLEDGRSVIEAFEAHYPQVRVSCGETLSTAPTRKNKQ